MHPVSFTIGSRRLASVERDLDVLAFSLDDVLDGDLPALPGADACDGLRVLSAPVGQVGKIQAHYPGYLLGAQERYARSYIDMSGGFDAYLQHFSGKTRSTLRRKRRKLEKASGGELDIRAYRRPEEMSEFLTHAQALSRKTYQARLLDAGLPEGEIARAEMMELAWQDRVRAFLLFLDEEAIAYLYLPVEGETLIYAYLGYDPDHASLSPGTVLQMAALEQLFAEGHFRRFDFTEGEGAHKAMFGTNSVKCASFLLLRPTFANRALLASLRAFEGAVAGSKVLLSRTGAETALRRLLRQ